jgi:hypothetical protein
MYKEESVYHDHSYNYCFSMQPNSPNFSQILCQDSLTPTLSSLSTSVPSFNPEKATSRTPKSTKCFLSDTTDNDFPVYPYGIPLRPHGIRFHHPSSTMSIPTYQILLLKQQHRYENAFSRNNTITINRIYFLKPNNNLF